MKIAFPDGKMNAENRPATRHYSRAMRLLLSMTEVAMLAYWAVAALACLNLISISPDYMYNGYGQPLIDAWNWSFMPVDVLFALCGLSAAYLPMPDSWRARLHDAALVLMFCAGMMALSFWAIRGEFDPLWWTMNLWLVGLSITAFTCRPGLAATR
jgi:hypothetical protein